MSYTVENDSNRIPPLLTQAELSGNSSDSYTKYLQDITSIKRDYQQEIAKLSKDDKGSVKTVDILQFLADEEHKLNSFDDLPRELADDLDKKVEDASENFSKLFEVPGNKFFPHQSLNDFIKKYSDGDIQGLVDQIKTGKYTNKDLAHYDYLSKHTLDPHYFQDSLQNTKTPGSEKDYEKFIDSEFGGF